MTPRTVYLHIGHNKTASSFLQSALAHSVDILAGHGLPYPLNERNAAAALAGEITGGNVNTDPQSLERALDHDWTSGTDKLVLSSEGLFNTLATPENGPAFLAELHRQIPDSALHVILYIRDPLGHAVSHYHQMVKRSGYTGDFAAFVQAYNTPRHVGRVVQLLERAGAQLTVVNYTRNRKQILPRFESWLGLAPDTLIRPPVGQVNRSLTLAELELQRLFNISLGKKAGRFISAPLCAKLPDIRSQTPHLHPEELSGFLGRMREMTQAAMAEGRIPEAEAWQIETEAEAAQIVSPPPEDMQFSFSQAQIDLLARTISGTIKRGQSK